MSTHRKYWYLGGAFGVIILLMATFGIVALKKADHLAELTGALYQHPFTVSNAILEANAHIISML